MAQTGSSGYGAKSYLGTQLEERAKKLIEECIDDARMNYARLDRDKADWLNMLYYRGGVDNQWVVWDKSTNAWVPRPYDGDSGAALPDWVPRAVTNIFAKKIDGIVSIEDQSAPTLEWTPATDDDEDVAAAEVIDSAMPALFDEIDFSSLRSQVNKFVTLIDKVAVHVYYDNSDKWGSDIVQALRCPECGQLADIDEDTGDPVPTCDCGVDAENLEPAVDEQFKPVGPSMPKGKLCARIIPSFELSLPRSARVSDAHANPWVLTHTRYPKEEALRCWPEARALIKNAGGSKSTMQRQYADAMQRLSSPTSGRFQGTPGGAADSVGPVVYSLHHDPTEQFPDGLYAVMIDEQLVEAGPLPFKDDQGRPFKNIIIRTYANAPGSSFNKPPADDLVPLQYWRNLIESLLALTLLHNAAPRTFIPMSVVLEDEITGQPGQNIRFRSMVPGEKPITESGQSPAEGLYKYLEILDQKFEEISGLNAVLMGNRPQGDPTLGEVQILQERGMATFKTPLDRLVDFEKRLAIMLLLVARQSAWAPRFRKIRGESGQWEVEQFAFTEIGGRVDVSCDPSTAWPRSPLMDNLKLKEAVGMGVVIPQMDPELSAKILSRMDLGELKPSMNADRKQIARQLDRWKKARSPQEILADPVQVGPWMGVQSLQLHWMLKTQFLKEEPVEHLARENKPLYMAMMQHVTQLQIMIMEMSIPQAAPGDSGGKGDANGKGKEQKPTPQPAGSQGDVLGSLVSQGVLQPSGDMAAMQAAQLPSLDDIIAQELLQPVMPPPAGAGGEPAAGV